MIMEQQVKRRPEGHFYYGWVVIGVALISMAFWFGFRSMFSVFLVTLAHDFGWGLAEISGVQSVAMICYIIAAPLVGGLVDRFGPRRIILPGIVLLAAGLALNATIHGLLQYYLFYGVLGGFSVAFISISAYTAIIPHWFEKRRGTASGIAASGMGLGIMLFPPITQSIISDWGWRTGFLAMGVLTAVVLLPLNGILLRHKPADMGYSGPDGRMEPDEDRIDGTVRPARQSDDGFQWGIEATVRTINFWALLIFPMLIMIGVYIVLTHFVGFLVTQGVSKMAAASIFGLIGLTSTIFRIVWGLVSDRIGRERSFSLGMFFFCISFYCLFRFQAGGGLWLVYLFVIPVGVGWGATAPIFMASAADLFHGPAIGAIFGLVEGSVGIGGAFGSWIGGYLFDLTGSYLWAFGVAALAAALAAIMVWVAAPSKGRALKERVAAKRGIPIAG
ncbi:MAG: MFS transporter [Desulfatiglandaceae bacterium]|jgi:MFS family permease